MNYQFLISSVTCRVIQSTSYLWQICSPVACCMILGCFRHDSRCSPRWNAKAGPVPRTKHMGPCAQEGPLWGSMFHGCHLRLRNDFTTNLWLVSGQKDNRLCFGTYNFSPKVSCLLLLVWFLGCHPGPPSVPSPPLSNDFCCPLPWQGPERWHREVWGRESMPSTPQGTGRVAGGYKTRFREAKPLTSRQESRLHTGNLNFQRALHLALHWDYKLHSWFWSQKNRFGEKKP